MLADLSAPKERLLAAAKGFDVGARVSAITLEPAQDDAGTNFLRVIVEVKNGEAADDAALEALLERIEGAVAELDERYPSVRFLDAA